MYIYESHLSGVYATDTLLSKDRLICNSCGDRDWLIGEAETREQAWELLKERTDINGSGGLAYDYVQEFLDETWGTADTTE